MAIPQRMNEVEVEITPLVVNSSLIDPDYREPIQKSYGTPFITYAQINYRISRRRTISLTGDKELALGRIVFRKSDLTSAGVDIKKGDLITSIAGIVCKYLINEEREQGHLRVRANLVHFDFSQYKFGQNSK